VIVTRLLRPEELATRQAYNDHSLEWALAHNEPGFWSEEMAAFAEMLPPPARILEVGAGTGRDAGELIAMGYGYTGIDFSEGMLTLARQRLPGADFRYMSVYELEPSGQPYDGFWAACSLLHIPRKRISEALTAVRRCLRPGAAGFIAMKQGRGEGVDDAGQRDMHRFFAWWQRGEFAEVLALNGFEVASWHKAGSRLAFFVRAA
jgi:ubiquinone/menaquinone biosynthesis C-methylase UbiE